ncbi:MAG TPA: DUF4097 family beta strand repeat protein [Firmicutes bacterium]|jgi:DUF4097 and DUF4098 domain-containing protein YvlB|nr:DUF4097 family beta strand repeat protein [Bacillota bacterium]
MQEERKIILRMLEEGKITAEEAEALLNALGDAPAGAENEPQEEPWVRLERMGEDFASKVEVAVDRFSRSLEQTVSEKLTKLPKILGKFPFLGFEESQEFTQVVRGPVGPRDVVPINLSNVNGPIRVQGWSEDYYQLTIVQRLRGRDRELLRSRLYEVGWEDGAVLDEFRLTVPSYGDRSISLHLMVPEGRTYEVFLDSQNGSLKAENLKTTSLQMETINGSTELRSVKALSILGKSGNGSVEMEGVEADSIRHRLGNGSYRVSVASPEVDLVTTNGTVNVRVAEVHGRAKYCLRTTNGTIKVSLPSRVDLGTSLDLRTSVGRITAELGSLEIVRHERVGGGAFLAAHSPGCEACGDQLHLEANCVSGAITVSAHTV